MAHQTSATKQKEEDGSTTTVLIAVDDSVHSDHALTCKYYRPIDRVSVNVGPSAWNDLLYTSCSLYSLLVTHPSKFYIFLKSYVHT